MTSFCGDASVTFVTWGSDGEDFSWLILPLVDLCLKVILFHFSFSYVFSFSFLSLNFTFSFFSLSLGLWGAAVGCCSPFWEFVLSLRRNSRSVFISSGLLREDDFRGEVGGEIDSTVSEGGGGGGGGGEGGGLGSSRLFSPELSDFFWGGKGIGRATCENDERRSSVVVVEDDVLDSFLLASEVVLG